MAWRRADCGEHQSECRGGRGASPFEGDTRSEDALNDIGSPSYVGARNPAVQSVFQYGLRSGCWRLLRIFKRFNIKISVLGVVRALEQCPELTQAFVAEGHEIVSHGYRWLDYLEIDEETERDHIRLAVSGIKQLTGQPPVGWFNGRPSNNTRRLLVEHGGFLYDRDYLGDELPFWVKLGKRSHLVIPTSFETNDNRFDRNSGFRTADGFARYMMDCFDLLYEEGAEHPKMMAINLHDRLIGRPAKAVGLIKFLEHAQKHDRVLVLHRLRHRRALAARASRSAHGVTQTQNIEGLNGRYSTSYPK